MTSLNATSSHQFDNQFWNGQLLSFFTQDDIERARLQAMAGKLDYFPKERRFFPVSKFEHSAFGQFLPFELTLKLAENRRNLDLAMGRESLDRRTARRILRRI